MLEALKKRFPWLRRDGYCPELHYLRGRRGPKWYAKHGRSLENGGDFPGSADTVSASTKVVSGHPA